MYDAEIFFHEAFEKGWRVTQNGEDSEEKCPKNTAVTRDASIKHEAATRDASTKILHVPSSARAVWEPSKWTRYQPEAWPVRWEHCSSPARPGLPSWVRPPGPGAWHTRWPTSGTWCSGPCSPHGTWPTTTTTTSGLWNKQTNLYIVKLFSAS